MNSMSAIAKWLALSAAALLVVACANKQMDAAQQALAGVDSALSAVPPDATKYIPDQVADVNKRRADLKASFDMKDYAAVISAAPEVLASAKGLIGATAEKKAAALESAKNDWTSLRASVPGELAALKRRVNDLSKSRHVPKGDNLALAQSSLTDASTQWKKAETSGEAGDFEEAVKSARVATTTLEAAAAAVKMKLPAPPNP